VLVADAVVFQVPEHCPQCRASGLISVEHTLKRRLVLLDWACRACAHRWPVVGDDRLLMRPKPDRRQDPTRYGVTGLVCPSCRKPVAVIDEHTAQTMVMTCPECGHRWTTDEPDTPVR
jgi:ribosomal protein L44E